MNLKLAKVKNKTAKQFLIHKHKTLVTEYKLAVMCTVPKLFLHFRTDVFLLKVNTDS